MPRKQIETKEEEGATPRTIGYCIANEYLDTSSAIVYFYPLGACSDYVVHLAPALDKKVQAKLISVDRPGCATTSFENKTTKDNVVMHRIHTHVQDILQVLKHEGIQQVYVLGVCIGHPYAVELSRQLLLQQSDTSIELKGMTLVAPFVSTACPDAWGVARFGSRVPNWMLSVASSVKSSLVPLSFKAMGPSLLKKIISPQEQEDFGWTEQDFIDTSKGALEMQDKIAKCQTIEVQVGVSPVWQEKVCDEFAKVYQSAQPDWNIYIRISKEDKLVSSGSVEWIKERCYEPCHVIVHDNIHSHETMTMFGGPARNPVVLYEICKTWNLYKEEL